MILDATCSAKRRWPAVADVRVDINPETHPDVVADDRHLPFKDGTFTEVYCDPPHLVKSYKNRSPLVSDETLTGLDPGTAKAVVGYRRFAMWPGMAAFHEYLDAVNGEFARVLGTDGRLHFKSTDGSRSHGTTIRCRDVIDRLTNFTLIEDRVVESQGYFAKWHKRHHGTVTLTHYLLFAKNPIVVYVRSP